MVRRLAAVAAAVALVAAGCGDSDSGDSESKEQVIGLVVPTQGAQVELGTEVAEGFKIGLADSSSDGWTFSAEIVDEGTTPDKAIESTRFLLGKGIKNIAGFVSTADCAAVAPVADQQGANIISTTCSSAELTSPLITDGFFSAAGGSERYIGAFAGAIHEEFPAVNRVGVFAWDYPPGHEDPVTFAEALGSLGQEVELDPQVFVPIQSPSFRSEISKMAADLSDGPAESKGVMLVTAGAATTNFLQQADAFELYDNVAFVGGAAEPYLGMRAAKGDFPNVWFSYDYFFGAHETPENQAFVEEFEAATGLKPSAFAWQGYAAARAIAEAIKEAGSSDPLDVREALLEIDVPTPSGTARFSENTHRLDHAIDVINVVGDPSQADGVKLVTSKAVNVGERGEPEGG